MTGAETKRNAVSRRTVWKNAMDRSWRQGRVRGGKHAGADRMGLAEVLTSARPPPGDMLVDDGIVGFRPELPVSHCW